MMRYFLVATLITAAVAASAQTDTVFTVITQESALFEKQQFAGPYDFVFLPGQPIKALLKWNALALLPNITTDRFSGEGAQDWRLEIAGEVAVGQKFSFNGFAATAITGDDQSFFDYLNLGIEPRFYFSRGKQFQGAANLSGYYIALANEAKLNLYDNPRIQGKERFWDQAHSIRVGMQRRLFRRGYVDINAGTGLRSATHLTVDSEGNILIRDKKWRHFWDLRLAVGWALSTPKPSKNDYQTCDFIQCFREENRMFQVDLLRLLPQFDNETKTIRPSVAYEQKAGDSPWSVNTEVALPFSRYRDIDAPKDRQSKSTTWGAELSVEPRYYFTLKKRIARGKSGNNLSGMYLGLHTGVRYAKTKSDKPAIYDYPALESSTNLRIVPVIGIQHRIYNRMYFGYKLGLGWEQWKDYQTFKQGQVVRSPWNNGPAILSELKIGLAF